MKRLMLVRHAKSSWKDESLADFDRPLNRRGEKSAPKVAAFLKNIFPCPDLMVASPAVRTKTTASIFASHFNYDEEKIFLNTRLYMCEPRTLLDVVSYLPDNVSFVALFGHNPALTEAIDLLCDVTIENFATCATLVIDFDCSSWKNCSAPLGKARLLVSPKLLEV
ncbi:MAG: histidine phosphatase family protein [Hahellaceae bacterium]|jgi:phosphohistidine phosphatase|nr:histidine phosphatase family protein [Hahellaceae bacterium]MCP5212916.1 histidine phosphatase family protein [Hahellaceae bacterium]